MGKHVAYELKSKSMNQIDVLDSILLYWYSIENERENSFKLLRVFKSINGHISVSVN